MPRNHRYRGPFIKVEIVFDTRADLAIGVLTDRGSAPDIHRRVALLPEADLHVKIKSLLADAGYDLQSNHILTCGLRHSFSDAREA